MVRFAIGMVVFLCLSVFAQEEVPASDSKAPEKNAQGYEEYECTLPDGKTTMTMIRIPAGDFQMGIADGYKSEMAHRVRLSEYSIGKHEVTNGEYRAFVKATGHKEPSQPKDEWGYANYFSDPQYDDFPVVCVSWEDAGAFCKWAGFSLPTEAQWEYAARGADGRKYPWGNEDPDGTRVQYGKRNGGGDYTRKTGSFPAGASACGALDMGGNVREWCSDWYDEKWYAACGDGKVDPECSEEGVPSLRVIRGGTWSDFDTLLGGASRFGVPPSAQGSIDGFRASKR